ncbi:MAG: hypothetical protein NT069_14645 [Planctomycetota bacterium]|nr:hypothetical protein [Planctomycetota bacterium]
MRQDEEDEKDDEDAGIPRTPLLMSDWHILPESREMVVGEEPHSPDTNLLNGTIDIRQKILSIPFILFILSKKSS